MPDSFMPDVQVEIAWDSGYATPAADRTWTDVSDYVELADGIRIGFGRQDERSTAGANTLALTLDNSDGRFTAGRSASPYYPNVKIGRPIRVTVTPPGGSASVRFVGFVDQWPVEWDGTDSYASAKITASSRLSRLGLSAQLRSMPEAQILASNPARYWTLGDPAGSTSASESSGVNSQRLTSIVSAGKLPPTFGSATGPPTDGLTAAEFVGESLMNVPDASAIGVPQGVRFSIRVPAPGGPTATIVSMRTVGGGAPGVMTVEVLSSGVVTASTLTGPNIADGLTHDVAFVWDATTAYLVVDGVTVDSGSTGTVTTSGVMAAVSIGELFTGTLAHVALWNSSASPTVADVQAQSETMTTAGVTERTDERLIRILGWARVASTEVATETGVETMIYQQTSGQSVIDALRDVESTEGGVLFDGRDGNVQFHNRSHRYLATPAATLDMASQHVGADYAPKVDRTALVNEVTVENPTSGESARAVNTASRDEYGVAATAAKSVATTYDALHQKAAWVVASYAEPGTRVPSLTVDVLAHQGLTPSAQTLLAVDVGDLLAVTNAPTQADTTSPSYFVEGGAEVIGPQSYAISFNLSPAHPSLSVLILDDADRGRLDEGYILGL